VDRLAAKVFKFCGSVFKAKKQSYCGLGAVRDGELASWAR